MNALKLPCISIVMFGLGLACFTARPCRAQAEINPDHYDEAPSSYSIVRPATATQQVAVNRSASHVNASTCAQAQAQATDAKSAGCNARVHASPAVVRAHAITSLAKETTRRSDWHPFATPDDGQLAPKAAHRQRGSGPFKNT